MGSNHLKWPVAAGDMDFDVTGFRMPTVLSEMRQIASPLDLAVRPVISTWSGASRAVLQL